MAKGKRSSGNTYTSKGQRPNTNKSVLKARRIEYKNPNKKETNKPFIRVNALDVWGPPREMSDMYSKKRKNDRVN